MPITEFSSTITTGKQGGLQMQCASRQFQFLLDEPLSLGGKDSAMNPVEALLGTLGACKGIVAKSFARMHKINLNDIRIEVKGELDTDGFTGKIKKPKSALVKLRRTFLFKLIIVKKRSPHLSLLLNVLALFLTLLKIHRFVKHLIVSKTTLKI